MTPVQIKLSVKDRRLALEWNGECQMWPADPSNLDLDGAMFALFSLARRALFSEEAKASPLDVSAAGDLFRDPRWVKYVSVWKMLLKKSDDLVFRWRESFRSRSLDDGVFFYVGGGHPSLKRLSDELKKRLPGKVSYEDFDVGWDLNTRQFGEAKAMSVDQLLERLLHQKVSVLVTLGSFLSDHYFNSKGIHLSSVLARLGIAYVIVDVDLYDYLGYARRAFHHSLTTPRFTVYPHFHRYWDRVYSNPLNHYIPNLYSPSPAPLPAPLPDDFEIVIASHARVQDLLPAFEIPLSVIARCREENLFDDFQHFYYAFRERALREPCLQKREQQNSHFYKIYIDGISLLKYEIIEHLPSDRRVLIFGDPLWGKLFPQYFQNRYLSEDELEEKLKDGKSLYLLMNANFSYREGNPVFQRALNVGVPFVCWPPLVHQPTDEAFRGVEYRSISELLKKLERMKEIRATDEITRARSHYFGQSQKCLKNDVDCLEALARGTYDFRPSFFDVSTEPDETQFQDRQKEFEHQFRDEIDALYESLLLGRVPFDPQTSRFAKRSYLECLYNLRRT